MASVMTARYPAPSPWPRALACAAAGLACALACGSGGRAPTPTTAGAAGAGDILPGNGGPVSPEPDAGPISNPPDSAPVTSPPGGSAVPAPDAGSGGGTTDGGPAPHGGVLDGGATEGGARAACEGLAPPTSLPEPVDRVLDLGTNTGCGVASAGLDGQVALGNQFKGDRNFDLFSAAGERGGGVAGFGLHAVPGGWQGLVPGSVPPVRFKAYDTAGNVIAEDTAHVAFGLGSLPDGSAVLNMVWGVSGVPLLLERFDAEGRRVWSVALDRGPGRAPMLEGDRSGNLLVLLGATSTGAAGWQARWFDAAGQPLVDWFDVPLPSGAAGLNPVLAPLLDGGLALGSDDTWRFALPDGVARADPAPAWLAGRPATRLAIVRGGKGHALISGSGIELVTPAGESCGVATFPPGNTPGGLFIGEDGTVLQQYFYALPSLGSGNRCGWKWWSGLLR